MRKFSSFKFSFLVVTLISFGICFSASAFAASKYEITDIGTLGGSNSYAQGINDFGQVVGYSNTGSGNSRAFLWGRSSGMENLGTFNDSSLHSYAYGINNSGQIVGQSYTGTSWLTAHAFLWERDSGMINLGYFCGSSNFAASINNNEQVVGETGYPVSRQAFLWERDSGMVDIGGLGRKSYAKGINDSGQIVGSSGGVGFLWEDGTMLDLNDLLFEETDWIVQNAQAIEE